MQKCIFLRDSHVYLSRRGQSPQLPPPDATRPPHSSRHQQCQRPPSASAPRPLESQSLRLRHSQPPAPTPDCKPWQRLLRCSDHTQQSPKMDIYSFGVLLREMLTQDFPDTDNRSAHLHSIRKQPLFPLVQRCQQRRKEDRPTASDIIAKLNP